MVTWVTALPVLVYYLGFTVTVPLYLFTFGAFFTRQIAFSQVMALVFWAFVFVFFVYLLGVQPWPGALDLPAVTELFG